MKTLRVSMIELHDLDLHSGAPDSWITIRMPVCGFQEPSEVRLRYGVQVLRFSPKPFRI